MLEGPTPWGVRWGAGAGGRRGRGELALKSSRLLVTRRHFRSGRHTGGWRTPGPSCPTRTRSKNTSPRRPSLGPGSPGRGMSWGERRLSGPWERLRALRPWSGWVAGALPLIRFRPFLAFVSCFCKYPLPTPSRCVTAQWRVTAWYTQGRAHPDSKLCVTGAGFARDLSRALCSRISRKKSLGLREPRGFQWAL